MGMNQADRRQERAERSGPTRVEVVIDEFVSHGFAPEEGHRLGDAVELELSRLLSEQGIPGTLAREDHRECLDVGHIEAPPGYKAGDIGTRIASAVYSGLKK